MHEWNCNCNCNYAFCLVRQWHFNLLAAHHLRLSVCFWIVSEPSVHFLCIADSLHLCISATGSRLWSVKDAHSCMIAVAMHMPSSLSCSSWSRCPLQTAKQTVCTCGLVVAVLVCCVDISHFSFLLISQGNLWEKVAQYVLIEENSGVF